LLSWIHFNSADINPIYIQ